MGGYFPTKDMQTALPQFWSVFMDDAQCDETKEISIFLVIMKIHRKLGL